MTTLTTPSRFDQLEAEIAKLPPVDAEVVHHFAGEVYGREMRIEAGTMLTGKIHKGASINVVCGDIVVFNDIDGTRERIVGMKTFVSKPGTRRAGFANAFTVWICFHANPDDAQDLEKIESRVIEKHDNPLLESKQENLQ